MIIRETIDGRLIHTYSDIGTKIHGGDPEGDYDEAYDPIDADRTYTETDIPVDSGEAEIEDYEAALERLGV